MTVDDRLQRNILGLHGAGESVAGTGCALADGWVLTCAHVVTTALSGTPEFSATPPTGQLKAQSACGKTELILQVVELGWGPASASGAAQSDSDYAFLRVTDDKALDGLTIQNSLPNEGGPIWCAGFPNGRFDEATGRLVRTQLAGADCTLPIEREDSWKREIIGGFSGAPVFLRENMSAPIGMIVEREARPGDDRRAFMIPGPHLASRFVKLQKDSNKGEDEEDWVQHHVSEEEKEAYGGAYCRLLGIALRTLNQQSLCALYGKFPGFSPSQDETANLERLSKHLIEWTKDDPCKRIRAVQRELGQQGRTENEAELGTVAFVVCAARISDDDHRYVAWTRGGGRSLRANAGSPTKAEILAAAIDRGNPEFLPRRVPGELPRGKMRIAYPPEVGTDPDGSAYLASIENFLQETLSLDHFIAGVEERLNEIVFGDAQGARAEGPDALANYLEVAYEDEQRSCYLTVPAGVQLDDDSKLRLIQLLRKLMERLPRVHVIALDREMIGSERSQYGPVTSAVPVEGDQ